MRHLTLKIKSPFLFTLLAILIFVTSCQRDIDQINENDFKEIQAKPQLPIDFESLALSAPKKSNGYFVYPHNNQRLDREGQYIFKANRNSTTTRYAILMYQNGVYSWNDYWGQEGLDGMHFVLPHEAEYFNFKLGKALVFLWHWTGSTWAYKTGFEVNLYHKWVEPVPSANQITSLCGWRTLSSGLNCHSGMDIGHSDGGETVENDPVRAVAAGKVVEADIENFGSVTIEHAGGRYSTRYRHLNVIESGITVGKTVYQGEQIGLLGQNGAPNMPHLHFEYFFGNLHEQFLSNPDDYYDCPLANFCYIIPRSITKVNNENDINQSLFSYCQGSDHFGRYCQ